MMRTRRRIESAQDVYADRFRQDQYVHRGRVTQAGGGDMLQVGDSMPAFSLTNGEREPVTDEAFRGSIAVIAFYPMAFTGG